MIRIGITGGIGSGKSTVCRIFEKFGVAVYDSDINAKRLMNEDTELRKALIAQFGEQTFNQDGLDRTYLASLVFSDKNMLDCLNKIVHPVVRQDFRRWCELHCTDSYVILESAILFDAGFDTEVDKTLAVVAPESLRIERVCKRDGMTREDVQRRIAQQMSDDELQSRADYTIANITLDYLRSDVEQLDKIFRYESHLKNIRA